MLDDQNLVRLVASWPKMTREQRGDNSRIGSIANIPSVQVPSVVERAMVHGLVYDDGSVNEFAQKYVNSLVASRLKKSK